MKGVALDTGLLRQDGRCKSSRATFVLYTPKFFAALRRRPKRGHVYALRNRKSTTLCGMWQQNWPRRRAMSFRSDQLWLSLYLALGGARPRSQTITQASGTGRRAKHVHRRLTATALVFGCALDRALVRRASTRVSRCGRRICADIFFSNLLKASPAHVSLAAGRRAT